MSAQLVKERLSLLSLADDIQHLVNVRQFPIGHANLITKLDRNRQRIALKVFNAAKQMSLVRFGEYVERLLVEQIQENQLDMFGFQLMQEVERDTPSVRSGKNARTGAPYNRLLPAVRVDMGDNVGAILDRHIFALLESGHQEAAEALGNVYNTLVSYNWTSVPAGAILPKVSHITSTAEEAAHMISSREARPTPPSGVKSERIPS